MLIDHEQKPSYFMLECFGPDDEERAGIDQVHGLNGLNWMLGSKFSMTIPTPIQITLKPHRGLMMPMFSPGILLFSDELLDAVHGAGVDNLDAYATELYNPLTQERFKNYKAINVVGVVSAADLSKSKFHAYGRPLIDVDFDSLAIDSKKAKNLLMFRLAECVSGIVVHERVKEEVDRRGIKYIDWVEPAHWIG